MSTQGTSAADKRGSTEDSLRLLTVRSIAKIFGVTEDAIRKRIRLRQIGPVIRRGRSYVMRAETLRRYLEEAEQEWERHGVRA